jgi:hypothetical protein
LRDNLADSASAVVQTRIMTINDWISQHKHFRHQPNRLSSPRYPHRCDGFRFLALNSTKVELVTAKYPIAIAVVHNVMIKVFDLDYLVFGDVSICNDVVRWVAYEEAASGRRNPRPSGYEKSCN